MGANVHRGVHPLGEASTARLRARAPRGGVADRRLAGRDRLHAQRHRVVQPGRAGARARQGRRGRLPGVGAPLELHAVAPQGQDRARRHRRRGGAALPAAQGAPDAAHAPGHAGARLERHRRRRARRGVDRHRARGRRAGHDRRLAVDLAPADRRAQARLRLPRLLVAQDLRPVGRRRALRAQGSLREAAAVERRRRHGQLPRRRSLRGARGALPLRGGHAQHRGRHRPRRRHRVRARRQARGDRQALARARRPARRGAARAARRQGARRPRAAAIGASRCVPSRCRCRR